MNNIPNGGFPLLKYCKYINDDSLNNDKNNKNVKKKQYFYSSKNNVNIRNILKKNNEKFITLDNNNDIITEINDL